MTIATILNLLEIRENLELSAVKIADHVRQTAFPFTIPALKLKPKHPELKSLPDTLPLFHVEPRERDNNDDDPMWFTVGVYRSDDGDAVVYGADLEPLQGFSIVSYTTAAVNSSATIKHDKSGQEFLVRIAFSQDFKTQFIATAQKSDTIQGSPDPSILDTVPRPEIPLRSNRLPENIELSIVRVAGTSREHNTVLVDVMTPNGLVKNVITNSALKRIAEKFLDTEDETPYPFIIAKKVAPKSKNSNWKISIKDPRATSYEDLAI